MSDERRQRVVAMLEERARLLRPPTAFYAAIDARITAKSSTGVVTAPPTFAADRNPEVKPAVEAAAAAAVAETPREPAENARAVSAAGDAVKPGADGPAAAALSAAAAAEAKAKEESESAAGSGRTEIDAEAIRDPSGVLAGGRIIAGYRIESLLGKGGMGEVYRATQLSVGRPVALKVLGKRLAGNPNFRERFLREARAAGRLHHHHLIAVHDVGEAGGLMFFSMELVEGRTLKSLRADGPMSPEASTGLIRQVLLALEYAHARGVVHRDIKPDNIMVSNGVVKVADLGLSRVEDDEGGGSEGAATTQQGAVMGTPHYMAPEQGRDAHAADPRSDLWAVGATWYFLHYGRPPFTGANVMDVLLKASVDDLVFPAPAPPPAVCAAIGRLMSKDPAARPASAVAALTMITALESTGRRRRGSRRRRPWWQYALAAGGLAVAAAGVVWAVRGYAHAVWWQGERERIEAMAQAGDYPAALAAEREDEALLRPGSEAEAGAAFAQELQGRWEAYAQDQASPLFARFDRDLHDKQYKEAQATLRQVPESLMCPAVKAAAEQRGEALEQALLDAADQAGGSASAAAADPDQRYLQETDALRREAVALAAERFWRAFACEPAGTLAVEDGDAVFTAVGHGQCDLRTTGPLAQLRARALTFHLHVSGEWNAEERWELDLGGARLAVTSAGIELAQAGQPARVLEPLPAKGDAVLRLRRTGGGGTNAWQCRVDHAGKADENPWITLAGGEVLEVAWSLKDGHALGASFAGRR
jgi:hypothetical protein